jgi:uncharacterized protein YjbI with pentapeptide repeats
MKKTVFWITIPLIFACNNEEVPVNSLFPSAPDTSSIPELVNYLDEDEFDSIMAIETFLADGRARPKGYRALPQPKDDFSGMKLDGIYWPNERVRNADFRGVTMRSANCRNGDYRFGDFRTADIRWSNFDGSALDSSNFRQTKLFHVKVNNASLNGCTFVAANMFGMEGHLATLRNCDFSGALMKDSEFVEADFTASKAVRTKLFRAVLKNAKIDSCDFSYADFTGAGLEESSFVNSRLWGANFQGSHLQGASFVGADLEGCDFFGASLENTDFNEARNIPDEIRKFINKEGFATGIWQDKR